MIGEGGLQSLVSVTLMSWYYAGDNDKKVAFSECGVKKSQELFSIEYHIELFLHCFSCLRSLRCWLLLNKLTVYGITIRGNVPIPSLETRCNQIYHQSRNVKKYHLQGTSCLNIRCLLTSYSDHQMAVTGEAFAPTFSCSEMWIFFCNQ